MGCDHFADENGTFGMEICLYNGGKVLRRVYIKGLEPFAKIDLDVVVGTSR